MSANEELKHLFPNLKVSGYKITSPATINYNCVGWAAGKTDFWWLSDEPDCYWPTNAPLSETVEAFAQAFAGLGYEVCTNSEWEQGYEKVAIYVDVAGGPTHAARQLPSGAWTSKLGRLEDVEHNTLSGLEGGDYGKAFLFLRKIQP